MSNVAPIMTPLARFQAYKEAQSFTSEQINAHNIQCVCDSAVLRVPAYVLPCVPFFYYNPDGTLGDRFRVRLLNPTPGKGKYWQPANSGDPGPYLPQGQWDWTAVFADASVPLVIPEGEAKSIIAQDYLKPLGIAVMAIGGVAMWRELLRREDIVWRGRKVIIAFDHDDGQEPGQYGPGVALQLSRFAEALAERGAVVSCTQLGIIARDQGMVGKVGLDDYFDQRRVIDFEFADAGRPVAVAIGGIGKADSQQVVEGLGDLFGGQLAARRDGDGSGDGTGCRHGVLLGWLSVECIIPQMQRVVKWWRPQSLISTTAVDGSGCG